MRARRPLSAAVLCRPSHGLANRLRALASCRAIAATHGLDFAVLWDGSDYLSLAGWDELFDAPQPLIDAGRFAEAVARGVPKVSDWVRRTPTAGVEQAPGVDLAAAVAALPRTGLVDDEGFLNLIDVLRRSGVAGTEPCRREMNRFLRGLKAAPEIQVEVDAFAAVRFLGEDVVGVHIRRGDAVQGPNREQYLVSSDEAFEETMRRQLAAAPGRRFFLATDCADTLARFERLFPGRIVARDKVFVPSVPHAPKGGIRDAVADLMLLSRTREILGTRWSSFGRMAASLGGIPFTVAGRGAKEMKDARRET